MNSTNFLIGRGHLLTFNIPAPRRSPSKKEVYSHEEALNRLLPEFESASTELDALPKDACPGDYAAGRLMMNPGYIARSFFPTRWLRLAGLESVGSRTVKVTPEKWSKKDAPRSCSTTELYVVGKRSAFRNLKPWAEQIPEDEPEATELARIEHFFPLSAYDRICGMGDFEEGYYEVGLHLISEQINGFVQQSFSSFAERSGIRLFSDLGFTAGNLWFVPVHCQRQSVETLAQFAFVRVIRPVPKLRGLRPVARSTDVSIHCGLPDAQPLSYEPKVAILDGGLPHKHPVGHWLRSYRLLDSEADDDPDGPEHGLGVTSAFLFGPITPNTTAERPYAYVDHLRVLDKGADAEDPLELYRTLGFIEEVLLSRQYQFINLSLGPDLPVEDTQVHAWTSVIDDLLSDGDTLMTVAVGNNGERDRESGNARVQVPSDCVNALAVGAANHKGSNWNRAGYSALGPGRSPGVIKPDLMVFGGDGADYFHTLIPGSKPALIPQMGTSFAAPYLLRTAVGVRAILGNGLTPLAIKALLVHHANPLNYDKIEVGWGKVPEDLMDLITCPVGVARIVYEGELKLGKYLRAPIPLPEGELSGNIRLGATFCYASPTDPQDAAAYTRAGLEVVFRPNQERTEEGKANANTRGFFDMKQFETESERRADRGKWETVLHSSKTLRGSGLKNPVFDIHYNAREGGANTASAKNVRYALIITVDAPRHPDLYNDILRAFAKTLVPIVPQIALPIRLR